MKMTWIRWIAVILLVLGAVSLIAGGFDYTKETHSADLGPLKLQVKEKDRFEIPAWAGVLAMLAGGGLWIAGKPRRP